MTVTDGSISASVVLGGAPPVRLNGVNPAEVYGPAIATEDISITAEAKT